MIRINLAPPARRPRRRRFRTLAIGTASVALLAALGWWCAALVQAEGRLTEDIALLERELAALQATLGRSQGFREAMSDLARRTQAIQELTRSQGTALRVLDALLDAVPSDAWLTALEGRGRELRAAGSARSARAVADFAANLRASGAFADVEIVAARQDFSKAAPGPVNFEVTCRFGP